MYVKKTLTPTSSSIVVPAQNLHLHSMVDLHGLSPDKAGRSVNWHLSVADQAGTDTVRFVTGRGNHVNSKGERGTLFREFPNWFSEENRKKISSIKKYDGYYEIKIKPTKPKLFNTMEDVSENLLASNIKLVKQYAEEDDAFYQYLLGHCYQFGIGLEQDFKEAVFWYEKSARQNNELAEYALGGCYWQGKGVRQNDAKAIELFKKSAEKKFVWALHQLGDIYFEGIGVTKDAELGQDYYQQAAGLGLDIAKRKLGHIFFFGKKGTKKDEKKAFALYKEVADHGDPHSAYNVAYAYLKSAGVEKNVEFAFKYAKQSADGNDPDGQYLTAMLFMQGLGTPQNSKLAFYYLTLSANNQFKHALLQLAFHPDIDKQKRLDYLIKAAKADQIVAQAIVLGILPDELVSDVERVSLLKNFWEQSDEEFFSIDSDHYKFIVIDVYAQNENLTRKQKAKIIRLLNILAKDEHPQAFGRLGAFYKRGDLLEKNEKKAEQCWLQGAKLGDAGCWCGLGYFYEEKGEFTKAFECYENAAQLGNANSYNQLGTLYKNGAGVAKNIEIAVQCFKMAMQLDSGEMTSEQRDGLCYVPVFPHAAYNLGMLYLLGDKAENFPADEEQAITHLFMAENAGSVEAIKVLDRLQISNRDAIHQKLQPLLRASFWKKSTAESTSITPINPQEKPGAIVLLNEFAEALNLKVDWKITNKDQAWCYVETKEVSRLEKLSFEPFTLRKTKNERYVLLLEDLSKQDIAGVTNRVKTSPSFSLRC